MSQLTHTQASARRTLLIGVLTIIVIGIAAASARATFPGENGHILFRTADPETGLGRPLFRALPDGTEMTVLNRRPGARGSVIGWTAA